MSKTMEKNTSENATAINAGIRGLVYNPDEILAMKASVEEQKVKEGKMEDGKYLVITREKKSPEFDMDIAVPNAYKDITYPGALLVVNHKLVEGKPNPLAADRQSMLISVDLPGLREENHKTVEVPEYSQVMEAIDTMVDYWFKEKSASYEIPANISHKQDSLYSEEHTAITFGCDVNYLKNKLGINFKDIKDKKESAYLIQFKQIFYTASVELPKAPADVFTADVKWEDNLSTQLNNDNPPGYVRNVQYGREVYLIFKSKLSSEELQANITGNLDIKDIKVDVKGDLEKKLEDKTISCTLITYGGAPYVPSDSMSSEDTIKKMNELISENVKLSEKNPAFPIAYTTAFLKDNQVAAVTGKLEYYETTVKEYSSGQLVLDHSGAYVARYNIFWDLLSIDENGNDVYTQQAWSKNGEHKTAHYSEEISLPANATHIRVKMEGATGLVWEPWRTTVDTGSMPLVPCRTIKTSGTTLNQKKDINPKLN